MNVLRQNQINAWAAYVRLCLKRRVQKHHSLQNFIAETFATDVWDTYPL